MQKIMHGGRTAIIGEDLPEASFCAEKYLHATIKTWGPLAVQSVRAIVEIQRNLGGVRWRAMLGGIFVPQHKQSLALDVGIADASASSVEPDCPGLLGGKSPYRVGLIEEFAPHALHGMLEVARQSSFGPGAVSIDRAAYDDESSSIIFRHAGRMLVTVLAALAHGEDPTGVALTELQYHNDRALLWNEGSDSGTAPA